MAWARAPSPCSGRPLTSPPLPSRVCTVHSCAGDRITLLAPPQPMKLKESLAAGGQGRGPSSPGAETRSHPRGVSPGGAWQVPLTLQLVAEGALCFRVGPSKPGVPQFPALPRGRNTQLPL